MLKPAPKSMKACRNLIVQVQNVHYMLITLMKETEDPQIERQRLSELEDLAFLRYLPSLY
jgi:hypothetical protein